MTNVNPPTGQGKLALPSAVYDVAKDATTIYLPALGTLYVALAAIWHWGYSLEVAGTVTALVTFLGVVLKVSTKSYNNSDKSNDGALVVDQSDPLRDKYVLDISTPLDEVADKSSITLRVDNQTGTTPTQASQ